MIETDSGCDYVAGGMTEEELWKDVTEHIVKAHGMKIGEPYQNLNLSLFS